MKIEKALKKQNFYNKIFYSLMVFLGIFLPLCTYLSYINSTDYDKLVLAVTDIIKEGSYLIYKAEDSLIANAFGIEGVQGTFAPGVVSRKKQLVPNLTTAIKNFK